jgi:hypothetical protein
VSTFESPGGDVAQAADEAAIPPNYRELIIQRILARTEARAIRSARISQPKVLWIGLMAGGNRRAICVEVIRETIITSSARDHWVFTFKNGQIWTAEYSYAECDNYSPFNELLKKR